jgi:hypothetical protein
MNLSQSDNLIRAITPKIIEFLFDFFATDTTIESDGTELLSDDEEKRLDSIRKRTFYDNQLIVSRCLPLIINVLHLSLPDKRMVDLNHVLENSIVCLESRNNNVVRAEIKLELIRAYLSMLNDCSDRAALKIVIASKKFFICLLQQLKSITEMYATRDLGDSKAQQPSRVKFLHEFVYACLDLIRNLLENSQAVKDIFFQCDSYSLLFQMLKATNIVLDKEMSVILNEMVGTLSIIILN